MIEQISEVGDKFSPLRGTEAERQAATNIDPEELNVTTDQKRWFLGTSHVPPSAHHVVADQAARLVLNSSSARGCWEGDTAFQSDDGKTYKCIAGNGTTIGQWTVIGSPVDSALSSSSTNAVENGVVKAALDGKSNVGHVHSYNSLTNIPTEFVAEGHLHDLSEIVDSGTAAGLDVPSSGDAASGQLVKGNDSRMTNARTPTAHTHSTGDVTGLGTAATRNVPSSGNAGASEAVLGADSRMTDARTPTAHTHSTGDVTGLGTAATRNVPSSGDAGASEAVLGADSRMTDARTPTAHTHASGEVTGLGTAATRNVPSSGDAGVSEAVLGGDSRMTNARPPQSHGHSKDDISGLGTAASVDVPSLGDAANDQAVLGADSRMTNARPPTSHTHSTGDVTGLGTAATRNVPSSGDAGDAEAVLGADSRMTNARSPTAHTHSYNDLTDKPTIGDGLPIGSVIGWVSAIGSINVPALDSTKWKKCEGGTISGGTYNGQAIPDYRDHFLRGNTSSGLSGGSDTHTHTLSKETLNTEADNGNCVVVESLTAGSTGPASNVPKYKTVIYILKYA